MATGMSRRRFMAAAAAGGVATLLPTGLRTAARAATDAATSAAGRTRFHFLSPTEVATCEAICARVVPSTDPLTGKPAPGAKEAHAVVFIDRLLAAFSLPEAVADNPAIYLRGPYSNRSAYPDYKNGRPAAAHPRSDFLTHGQTHYMPLTPLQELSWRALIEGIDSALSAAPRWLAKTWSRQVKSGLIPGPPADGLQQLYRKGLAAFDSMSRSAFGVPFAQASPTEQDLMLQEAGNVIISQAPVPAPIGAPADAKALFPYVVSHTFEGCYGLPEYRGMDHNPLWAEIGWDGDTQPLGNSIYDEHAHRPGAGPNAGFGEPGVFLPRGDYREHRPVSTLGSSRLTPTLTKADIAPLIEAWKSFGLIRLTEEPE